jgi:autotransporter-associated beta strand protein
LVALAAWAAGLPTGGTSADFLWDGGGGDDFWTTDGNWDPDGAPGFDLGAQTIEFGATGGAQSPDVAGGNYLSIGGITFTTADSSLTLTDTVGGGSLSFVDGGSITNDSAFLQTINIDLIGTGSDFLIDAQAGDLDIGGAIDLSDTGGVLLTVAGDFDTILSGVISGMGAGILKTGDGTLTLSGDNTFTKSVELTQGTIVLGHDNALGLIRLLVTGDGTIQSDNDSRAIANRIEIDNDVTLTVSGGFDLQLDGKIEGAGGLEVNLDTLDDKLVLGRDNTYGGGTTLTQGTIVLGGNAALGAGDLTVTGNGALQSDDDNRSIANDVEIDAGATLAYSGESHLQLRGVISGDGGLEVNGDTIKDQLILTGDNTYTGGTTLTKGTIVLGHDNALGTGDLSLAGNGVLRSNDDERRITNKIDTGGNTLTVAGKLDLTLAGKIRGAGGLQKNGDGILTLIRNNNNFTGDTDINGGALTFDDASVAGLLNINDGGTFSGTGTVGGNLTVFDGGILAPGANIETGSAAIGTREIDVGADIGTLTVDGDFDLQDGATLQIQFDADELIADLLDVAGTATLANGSTIEASVRGQGYIVGGQTFTIIDAAGGVTDNGAEITTDSATVTVSLIRDEDFVNGDLEYALQLFRAANAYSAAANVGTNKSIGLSLDSTIPFADSSPNGPAADLLGRLDGQDGRKAYNTAVSQLSPAPYDTLTAAGLGNTRNFVSQQAIYLAGKRAGIEAYGFGATPQAAAPLPGSLVLAEDDPLILASAIAQAETNPNAPGRPGTREKEHDYRWGRYFKVQGIFIDEDSSADRTGFDSDSFGGQLGVDYEFSPNLIAGLALGYLYTNTDYKQSLGEMDEHSVRFGPYMSYASGNWYLDASATFAWHFYDGERNIPALDLTADSDFDGWDATGYLGTGYRFEVDRNLFLTPIASVLYSHFEFEDFTESGAGGANLDVDDRSADSLRSRLGANLSYRITDWAWEPIPYVYVGWEHEFLADDDDEIEATFATGGNPFTIDSGSRDEDAVFVGLGVNMLIKQNVSAFFRFEKVIADDSDVSAFAGGLSVAF